MQLVNEAFSGLDATNIVDVHVHLIGLHPQESGCFAHENMDNCCRCTSYSKKWLIMQAAGMDIDNVPDSDKPYYQRLVQLFENFIPTELQNKIKQDIQSEIEKSKQTHPPLQVSDNDEEEEKSRLLPQQPNIDNNGMNYKSYGSFLSNQSLLQRPICPKAVLLGLDQVYNKETGVAEPHNTSVYTPETYVEQVYNENQHVFLMGPSINPYRKDCLEKIAYFKGKGCNLIKWLPNSMGIDPMDRRCDAFYDKLAELDMFLLTHTGQEHSLDDADYTVQAYGNPLRYRRALEKGCKIIMAHCASEGSDEDLDEEKKQNQRYNAVNSCDLFIRLMREDKYKGQLFGDISAITAFKRVEALKKVIQAGDIHDRLIYGSDYPVPCVNAVVWYGRLVSNGLLTEAQVNGLREVYAYNPLLADFVSKRVMRYKDEDGKVHKFADTIFQQYALLCGNLGAALSVKEKKDQ